MNDLIIVLIALLAVGPLTVWGVRFARKFRRSAMFATSFLMILGLNLKVDPPPPPRIEAVREDENEAENDEPK